MKNTVKYILQKLMGFENYLFAFSLYKIYTLPWDRKENDFFYFLKMIPPGSAVLDIGANIGVMTVSLAKRIKDVEIFSFEPMPANLSVLKRILSFFRITNVRVFEFALGENTEKIEMVMPIVNSVKMHGLSHVVHESIAGNNKGEIIEVNIRKLDDLMELKNSEMKISAIKMDVENFEYFVLLGGTELLSRHRPLVYLELWENENREKCFEFIRNIGYEINIFQAGQIVKYQKGLADTQNFIFIPIQ